MEEGERERMEGKRGSSYLRQKRCIVEYLKILIWKVLAYRPRFQRRTDLASARGEESIVARFGFHRASRMEIRARPSCKCNLASRQEEGKRGEEGKNREGRERERGGGGGKEGETRRGHLVAARCVDALGY